MTLLFPKPSKKRRTRSQEELEDEEYRAWLQTQPSCISGLYSEFVNGEGKCVAAHVRRSRHSGFAFKPLFSAVPLTQAEHLLQHRSERAALLPHFPHITVEEAKAWFDAKAAENLARWRAIKSR